MRDLVATLSGSLIRRIADRAMDRPGLIALWFGESDQPTDPAIVAAAQASLARGETRYSANLGLPALRAAIADYQARVFGTAATADTIAVTSSALNAILLAMTTLVDPGDEVVVLTPSWPNIPAIPRLLNAVVREVPLRLRGGGFALDLDELADALGPRTRAVLINSPHNPTGWRMGRADMAALAALLERRGIWLIADEVYSRILDDGGDLRSFLDHFDDEARVVVINSFSKSWAMTGWRLGWITAPRRMIDRLEQLIEFNTSCSPVFVQHGGIAALGPVGEAFLAQQSVRLARARAVVTDVLGRGRSSRLPGGGRDLLCLPQGRRPDRRRRARRTRGRGGGRHRPRRGVRRRRERPYPPLLRARPRPDADRVRTAGGCPRGVNYALCSSRMRSRRSRFAGWRQSGSGFGCGGAGGRSSSRPGGERRRVTSS